MTKDPNIPMRKKKYEIISDLQKISMGFYLFLHD